MLHTSMRPRPKHNLPPRQNTFNPLRQVAEALPPSAWVGKFSAKALRKFGAGEHERFVFLPAAFTIEDWLGYRSRQLRIVSEFSYRADTLEVTGLFHHLHVEYPDSHVERTQETLPQGLTFHRNRCDPTEAELLKDGLHTMDALEKLLRRYGVVAV